MNLKIIDPRLHLQQNLLNLSDLGLNIEGHTSYVKALDVCSKTKRVLTGSSDRTMRLWSLESRKLLGIFRNHSSQVNAVLFFDDQFGVSGSQNLKIWNLRNLICEATLVCEDLEVKCLRKIESKNILVAACVYSAFLWNFQTRTMISVIKASFEIKSVIQIHELLGVLSDDCLINIYEIKTLTVCSKMRFLHEIQCLAHEPGSDNIVVATSLNLFEVWDFNKKLRLMVSQQYSATILCMEITSNKELICGFSDNSVAIIKLCVPTVKLFQLELHSDWVNCLKYCESTDEVITCSEDKTVKIFSLSHPDSASQFDCHSSWVSCLTCTSDSSLIVSAANDHTIRLWCPLTRSLIATYTGHSGLITSLLFNESESLLISGSVDKSVRIWNVPSA